MNQPAPAPHHYKLAASALRKRTKVVRSPTDAGYPGYPGTLAAKGGHDRFSMQLDGKEVGELWVDKDTQHVAWSRVDEKYQGMGLGKKMYGEAMKEQPGGKLYADSVTSDKAMRVWKGFKRRGYKSGRNPLAWPGLKLFGFRVQPGGAPNYTASLPESARKALGIKDLPLSGRVGRAARQYGMAAAQAALLAGAAVKGGRKLYRSLRGAEKA